MATGDIVNNWHAERDLYEKRNAGTEARQYADRLAGKGGSTQEIPPEKRNQPGMMSIPPEQLAALPIEAVPPIENALLDKSDKALQAAAALQRKKAEFYSTGEHAWAADFLDTVPGGEPTVRDIDLAGAKALEGLKTTSSTALDATIGTRLAALKDKTNKLISEVEEKQATSPDYDEALKSARAAQKAIEAAEKERAELAKRQEEERARLSERPASALNTTPEARAREEEEFRKAERNLNEKHRAEMIGVLDSARIATQDYKVAEAQVGLAEARKSGDQEKIANAEYNVKQQQDLRKLNTSSVGEQMDGAADYQKKVDDGIQARKDLRQQGIDNFVDGLIPDIKQIYEKKIAEAKLANTTNIGKQEEEIENLNAERDGLIAKLQSKANGSDLTAQMQFVTDRIQNSKPKLSPEATLEAKSRMLESALKYDGDPRNFAASFLKNDSKLSSMAAVSLQGLSGVNADGERVTVNAQSVMEVKITGTENDPRVEIKLRGNSSEKITVSGDQAKRIVQNGLDVGAADAKGNLHVNVDIASGIGGNNKFYLHGSHDKNIKLAVSGGVQNHTADADPEKRAGVYASVASVGGSDPRLDDTAGEKAMMARVNAAKKDRSEGLAMLKKLDVDGNRQLSQDELALLDRDGDGKLSKNEISPKIAAALGAIMGGDTMLALKDLNNGKLDSIEIATLGNVQLPQNQQKTMLAQSARNTPGSRA